MTPGRLARRLAIARAFTGVLTAAIAFGASDRAVAAATGHLAQRSGVPVRGLHATDPGTEPCAWTAKMDSAIGGFYEYDTNATYWFMLYSNGPGASATYYGAFPKARFMSMSFYGDKDQAIPGAALFDAELTPSSGVNPFQPGQNGTGTYEIHVVSGRAPASPASNTIYTGSTTAETLQVIYRVYDSNASTDTGGVGLPSEVTSLNGAVTGSYAGCYDGMDGDIARRLPVTGLRQGARPKAARARQVRPARRAGYKNLSTEHRAPRVGSGAIQGPRWTIVHNSVGRSVFTSYLASRIDPTSDEAVVVEMKTPSFADTDAGQPPWEAGQQVRYWSMCAQYASDYVAGCLDDSHTVTSSSGEATFVISAVQPTNATAANGINWLPLGPDEVNGVAGYHALIYRQILAAPSFAQSVAHAVRGLPALTMGSYFPLTTYCQISTLEQFGVTACLHGALGLTTARSPGRSLRRRDGFLR